VEPRARWEQWEEDHLAPGATRAASCKGREVPVEPSPYRTEFQRDRDRIVHSKAFRRLKDKTQVFLAPSGDHYRVRLTHTLEVAGVALTIARALRLNEDLCEAIALGHDLGHTPFGHMGEVALSAFCPEGEPWRHALQSLRVVEVLESLNLTWEVRDGIVNHTWHRPMPSTLEGQVGRYADRIAYLSHDVDDAIRAGVIAESQLPDVVHDVLGHSLGERYDTMVGDVIAASSAAGLTELRMSDGVLAAMHELRRFMFSHVYVQKEQERRAVFVLSRLMDHYLAQPDELPEGFTAFDWVAGMTDEYALRDFERVYLPSRHP
jgi:dGTPase